MAGHISKRGEGGGETWRRKGGSEKREEGREERVGRERERRGRGTGQEGRGPGEEEEGEDRRHRSSIQVIWQVCSLSERVIRMGR